jgi:hypothetical protein
VVARIANEAIVGSGGICVWQESGFCSHAVGTFGRSLDSVVMLLVR